MSARELAMIVAMDRHRLIGREGDLPWRFREDLAHFKRETLDHAIVMGRKTFESIGRPLPRRTSLVGSRHGFEAPQGVEVFPTLEAALERAYQLDARPFVVGGGMLYELALPLATELIVTEIEGEYEGDAYFPEIPGDFVEVDRREGETPGLTFRWLRRDAFSEARP
jgi:dihydrofolate reductase